MILDAVLAFPVDVPRFITLTTDFGLRDGYVASMKGVILGIAPHAAIVDVSHHVAPQDIAEAGYLLESIVRCFNESTVHLAVVDPGVGTSRLPIAVETTFGTFVGPDNGIFASLLAARNVLDPESGSLTGGRAVVLSNRRFHRHPVSDTFHGRDIFSPAAAHLATGAPLADLGPPLEILAFGPVATVRRRGDAVYGIIRHIDHFGNLITNIRASDLPADPIVETGSVTLRGLAANYQDAELSALLGSGGFLEIAARNGSAARRLDLNIGDEVSVRTAR